MCCATDENESHAIDRYATEAITCMKCETVQVCTVVHNISSVGEHELVCAHCRYHLSARSL